jgi:hypothetical protein
MSLDPKPVGQTEREQRENVAQAAEAERRELWERFRPIPYSPELRDQYPTPIPLFERNGLNHHDLDDDGEPRKTIEPVIVRGTVSMLAAAGGVGKSLTGLAMAVHVALADFPGFDGRELWGAWRLHRVIDDTTREPVPTRAVVILGEDPMGGTLDRLDALLVAMFPHNPHQRDAAREHMHKAGSLHLAAYNGGAEPLTGEDGDVFGAWLRATIRELDPDLVFIDPAVRFMGEDGENDNRAASEFVAALETLHSSRTAVIVAHHTTKASRSGNGSDATAARGASALTDNCRAVFNLVPNPNAAGLVTLKHVKHNFTPPAPSLALTTHGQAMRSVDELTPQERNTLMDLATTARAKALATRIIEGAEALVTLVAKMNAGQIPQRLAEDLMNASGRDPVGGPLAGKDDKADRYRDACAVLKREPDEATATALDTIKPAKAKRPKGASEPPAPTSFENL